MHRKLIAAFLAILALIFISACDPEPDAQRRERARQQDNYAQLTKSQPAKTMNYSPTRETINFWIETWDEPGKLSYVYIMASNGELIGYYVLEGLPVSYCASLTPTYRIEPEDGPNLKVPAPAMDGVYYFGSPCTSFYGKDATTGTYIEYTAGTAQNILLYEEPLPRQDVQPLGPTTTQDVKGN